MQFGALPECEHPAVRLRPLTAADVPAWFAYLSQPIVFEHTSWNLASPTDLARYAGNADTRDPSTLLRLAVADRATDSLVGTVGFHTVMPEHRSAELAYDLSPAVWGKGIATHVVEVIVEWAHSHVGLRRVQATVLSSNARSSKVLERCGFEREGLLRSFRMVRGRPGDFWMYSHVADR
jgi:[ribosomal protein S5]-alanine N-acetyltransferase